MVLWWILAAGMVAAICGAIIGPPALRLRGLYLAIVTIGVVFIGQHLFNNIPRLSGGPPGRAFPAPQFGFNFVCPQSGCAIHFSQDQTLARVTFDKNRPYYYPGVIILPLRIPFLPHPLPT